MSKARTTSYADHRLKAVGHLWQQDCSIPVMNYPGLASKKLGLRRKDKLDKLRGITLVFAVAFMGTVSARAAETIIPETTLKTFSPLPAFMKNSQNAGSGSRIMLGRMLYYDARLSANQKISCNSCHDLDRYGADTGRVSIGFRGKAGVRNSPTVYNAAGQLAQFWDGRSPDVEAQAKGPMMNPVEMAMSSQERIIATVKSMPEYVALFVKAFPEEADPVTFDNIGNAIGVFERGLVTPARWDSFLEGNKSALSSREKAGFNKFFEAGCASCHNGPYLGGSQYQRLGLTRAWPDTHDPGRFAVTGKESDRNVFKVPLLRNVAKTSPYYHDGSVATLGSAIQLMGEYQVGTKFSAQERDLIAAFLNSLTGQIPLEYVRMPKLPSSTASTPKPIVTLE